MNKKLFLVVVIGLLIGSTKGFSQSYLGARVGANVSNVFHAHEDPAPRIGVQAGVVGMFRLSRYDDKLYLQPEVNYSNEGEVAKPHSPINADGDRTTQKVNLNFVNVPIQVKYYLQGMGNYFYVSAGPYIGFRVTDNIKEVYHEDGDLVPTLATHYNKYAKLDYGVVAEIGYSLSKNFEVSARYSFGIPNMVEVPKDGTPFEPPRPDDIEFKGLKSTHNSVITVGISYFFDLSIFSGRGTCYF